MRQSETEQHGVNDEPGTLRLLNQSRNWGSALGGGAACADAATSRSAVSRPLTRIITPPAAANTLALLAVPSASAMKYFTPLAGLIARSAGQGKYRGMAKDYIPLGEVAAHGAAMLEIRCSRCDRHGRLLVARLLAEWGPDASIRDIMQSRSAPARTGTTRSYTPAATPIVRRWCSCFPHIPRPAENGVRPDESNAGADHLHTPAVLRPEQSACSGALSGGPGEREELTLARRAHRFLLQARLELPEQKPAAEAVRMRVQTKADRR